MLHGQVKGGVPLYQAERGVPGGGTLQVVGGHCLYYHSREEVENKQELFIICKIHSETV